MKRQSLTVLLTFVLAASVAFAEDENVESRIATPGKAVKLVAVADRSLLAADGADATVINIQAFDAAGNEASDSCELVTFDCSGAGKIIGVGNGNPISHEEDVFLSGQWRRKLFNGKCQVVVKAARTAGDFVLSAGLETGGLTTVRLTSQTSRTKDIKKR